MFFTAEAWISVQGKFSLGGIDGGPRRPDSGWGAHNCSHQADNLKQPKAYPAVGQGQGVAS